MTFEEVLEKHEQNIGKYKGNSYDDYYYYYEYGNGMTKLSVYKYINTNCEECFVLEDVVKSFTSPEKLDQFLTLLFEEE